MNPYIKQTIIKKQGFFSEEYEDYIAIEKKLSITVKRKEILSLYCTPVMIKELVIGLLLTDGLITDMTPLEKMKIKYGEEITVAITSGKDLLPKEIITSRCLGGNTFNKRKIFKKVKDDFFISVETLKILFERFHQKADLFKLTGCFHSAALSDGKYFFAFAEDIGRHNTVDKVIGYSILKNISFAKKIMLVSCRLSSEIVAKCIQRSIPIIASRAASTDLAIKIAEEAGVTLVGFVRGDRMNVYSHPYRIR